MFHGIGLAELAVILVVVLILFGPGKLPEVGKALGKAIGEFKRGMRDGGDDDSSKSDSSKKSA